MFDGQYQVLYKIRYGKHHHTFVNYMFHFNNGMFSLKYTVKCYNNGGKTAFNIVVHFNLVLKGIKTFKCNARVN